MSAKPRPRIELASDGRGYDVDELLRKITRLEKKVRELSAELAIRPPARRRPPPPAIWPAKHRNGKTSVVACPVCARVTHVNLDGRLRAHRADPSDSVNCAGSLADGTFLALAEAGTKIRQILMARPAQGTLCAAVRGRS